MAEHAHEKVRQLFDLVAALPKSEREAALIRLTGGDVGLEQRVLAMVAASEEAPFLCDATADTDPECPGPVEDAAAFAEAASSSQESVGQQIDRYKLLEQIGEGGFGSVWAAEQKEPVKRRVALKIIKLGMDTGQVIARFEAERQALAMMDHPNIARVLDAGTTEAGRPFFVMELVKGVPIIEYCDTEKLDTAARLELFAKVCHAIQHAHQKGIIHRDIKPSNVLVTLHDGVPVPKVIDFGIAKATNAELTEKTIYTQHRQMIGTPAYMSPEQAEMSGLDIDTRSDVYSLGVLLYEVLTGTTPFTNEELAGAGFEGMMRLIREVEPHKPSTRLSSLGETATKTAQQRRSDVQKLGLLLRGDLDWIVMKCLEKDRTRRYETANGLAADIRRHLDDEPVEAGPPGTGYRLGKFVKRNRGAVIAGSLVFAALSLGVIGTSLGMAWALRERQRAEHGEQAAQQALIGMVRDGLRTLGDEDVESRAAAAGIDLRIKEEGGEIRFLIEFQSGESVPQLAAFASEILRWLDETAEVERDRSDRALMSVTQMLARSGVFDMKGIGLGETARLDLATSDEVYFEVTRQTDGTDIVVPRWVQEGREGDPSEKMVELLASEAVYWTTFGMEQARTRADEAEQSSRQLREEAIIRAVAELTAELAGSSNWRKAEFGERLTSIIAEIDLVGFESPKIVDALTRLYVEYLSVMESRLRRQEFRNGQTEFEMFALITRVIDQALVEGQVPAPPSDLVQAYGCHAAHVLDHFRAGDETSERLLVVVERLLAHWTVWTLNTTPLAGEYDLPSTESVELHRLVRSELNGLPSIQRIAAEIRSLPSECWRLTNRIDIGYHVLKARILRVPHLGQHNNGYRFTERKLYSDHDVIEILDAFIDGLLGSEYRDDAVFVLASRFLIERVRLAHASSQEQPGGPIEPGVIVAYWEAAESMLAHEGCEYRWWSIKKFADGSDADSPFRLMWEVCSWLGVSSKEQFRESERLARHILTAWLDTACGEDEREDLGAGVNREELIGMLRANGWESDGDGW